MSHSQTAVELQVVAPPATVILNEDKVPDVSKSISTLAKEPPTIGTDAIVEDEELVEAAEFSKKRSFVVIASVTCITGISTILSGLITIAIPAIAADVHLERSLLIWPSSIYALVCGCTLLISGSLSDVIGARFMYLLGCFFQACFTLACGLARTGPQLIVFRAFSGLSLSFCLPSATSIITHTFPPGKRRNLAFATMGGFQPLGFSLGLIVGGVLTDTIGWRWGFNLTAILNVILFISALWALPKTETQFSWTGLKTEIDWVGAFFISTSLAILSYIFAALTGSTSVIQTPAIISLLIIAVALIPAFVFWVHRQERLQQPALIPNSLWRNRAFTSTCLCVFLIWGTFNAAEQLINFFFQYVQKKSALETSERFLPNPISGTLANIAVGLLVHKVRADWIVVATTATSLVPPLIMALIDPEWTYWAGAFPANLLIPVAADGAFTIASLLISSVFPRKTQGLAGGVFNTASQIGKSVGLALSAVIASSVTAQSEYDDKESPAALMFGYRAAFWYCLALNSGTLLLSIWGLRKIGKVGLKKD